MANILPADTLSIRGIVSIGQKSTFSEHGYVAYQITGNHEMQQHGHNMVETVQISLLFIELKLVDRLFTLICMIPKVN